MAEFCEIPAKVERWVFTEETLARKRGLTHERTTQALFSTAAECGERRHGIRESPKPLSLEESKQLSQYHLQRIPELCRLCGAPADVRWTAIVFYQRFFAVRSPMEFDPLPMMFACIHLACKVEEVHEITLDTLCEVAEPSGGNDALKARVASLELHLLEGMSFTLLVEPKPDVALHGLADELQRLPAWGGMGRGLDLHPTNMEHTWCEIISASENLMMYLTISTDAGLYMPTPVIAAAALGSVLGRHSSLGSDGGQVLEILQSLLETNVDEPQKESKRRMFQKALQDIERLSLRQEITEDSVREITRIALRCQRAFERLREEATERHEANRKERKRRWCEMKGANRRQIPTPFMQGLAELNRRAAEMIANESDDFVIHGPREDSMMNCQQGDLFVGHL